MAHHKIQVKNKYLKLLIKKSNIKKGGESTVDNLVPGTVVVNSESDIENDNVNNNNVENAIVGNQNVVNNLSKFLSDSIFTSLKNTGSNSNENISKFLSDSIFTSLKNTTSNSNTKVSNEMNDQLSKFLSDSIFTSLKNTTSNSNTKVSNEMNDKLSKILSDSIFTSLKNTNLKSNKSSNTTNLVEEITKKQDISGPGFPKITKQVNLQYGGGLLNFKQNGRIIQNNHIYSKNIPEKNIETIIFTKINRFINSNENLFRTIIRDGVDLRNKQLTYYGEIYNDVKNILITYSKNKIVNRPPDDIKQKNVQIENANQKMADFLTTAIFDSMKNKDKNESKNPFNFFNNKEQKNQMAEFLTTAIFDSIKQTEKNESKEQKNQMAEFLTTAIFDSIKQTEKNESKEQNKQMAEFLTTAIFDSMKLKVEEKQNNTGKDRKISINANEIINNPMNKYNNN